jgi:hypothetical protein
MPLRGLPSASLQSWSAPHRGALRRRNARRSGRPPEPSRKPQRLRRRCAWHACGKAGVPRRRAAQCVTRSWQSAASTAASGDAVTCRASSRIDHPTTDLAPAALLRFQLSTSVTGTAARQLVTRLALASGDNAGDVREGLRQSWPRERCLDSLAPEYSGCVGKKAAKRSPTRHTSNAPSPAQGMSCAGNRLFDDVTRGAQLRRQF